MSDGDFRKRLNQVITHVAAQRLTPEFRAKLAHKEAEARDSLIRELRTGWNAPKRHVCARPEFCGAWGEKFSGLQRRLGSGIIVGLIGGRGTGKTQLGVELMKEATRNGRRALFRSAMELFMRFKRSYRTDSGESELEVLGIHRRPSLLVIDEVARRGETLWENNLLFELLNQRHADMTDTILTCNLSAAEFEASLGPSIISRMQEGGGIIECDWPSFRWRQGVPGAPVQR